MVSEESKQQQRDELQITRIEGQISRERGDWSNYDYRLAVIWLLVFIARKLNKPYLDVM